MTVALAAGEIHADISESGVTLTRIAVREGDVVREHDLIAVVE